MISVIEKRDEYVVKILPILFYPAGDAIAQLIMQEFNVYRTLAILTAALLFYRWEIPNWFEFLENSDFFVKSNRKRNFWSKLITDENGKFNWSGKTLGAIIYFNPVWVARHMFMIKLGTGMVTLTNMFGIMGTCFILGIKSFIVTIPLAVVGNFIVQAYVPFKYRFLGSSILSGIFAVTYAVSYRFL